MNLRLFAGCCLLALNVHAQTISGYFGDRSGVYRNSNPPTRWAEGTNVLWKVPVPNLGNAAPIVAGNRVFVLSEPGWTHDLPVISCYDADTGKVVWEKEIDHLSLTVKDEAERQKIRDHWHKHLAWIRDYYLLFHDYSANKESADVKSRMAAMGVETWGANYLYGKFDEAKVSEYAMGRFQKKFPEVGKALVGLDTWRCMGSHDQMWIGEVFGTPVTDGQAIYVATAWGVYASYDLDGKLRWMHALSANRPHDYCAVARSPIIYRDLVISDLGRMVRAFDRATGALKWEQKRTGGVHEFVSPVVMRVGQQDILWCAGPAAYTLPDGKPLTIEGWNNNGMMVAVNTDRPDTLFMVGGGEHGGWEGKGKCPTPPPAALRFTLDGDVLKAKVLWNLVNNNSVGGCLSLIYHAGKLYFGGAKGVILDAETGIVLKGLFGGAVPAVGHHMALAGNYVYGLDGPHMTVCTVDGRFMAKNTLKVTPFAELDKDNQTKRLSQWFAWPKATNRDWCFSYSNPFAVAGDRLYIRSLDHLYCIAGRAEALPSLPAAAGTVREQQEALVKQIVGSNLSDHQLPVLGGQLYDLGPIPRALLAPLEAKVDERLYPFGGPKLAQDLLTAFYRRSGEVGFAKVHVEPFPWAGGPQAGKEVRLSWQAVNATKVRIEPSIGEVPVKGEHKLTLDQPATYTFTAEGPGGPTVRKVTIRFREPTAGK